ncbi:hypothetical protein EVAR_95234_1 [Eumeta japonica]|uniref:Uncharacterized protein n=1 Tax=Eumeta variegata TaxID=151549 RepID=A0A4C1UJU3_EUMVA|nr:hypothetical protein EVAR_95234_1 [Eumeta japonica]
MSKEDITAIYLEHWERWKSTKIKGSTCVAGVQSRFVWDDSIVVRISIESGIEVENRQGVCGWRRDVEDEVIPSTSIRGPQPVLKYDVGFRFSTDKIFVKGVRTGRSNCASVSRIRDASAFSRGPPPTLAYIRQ